MGRGAASKFNRLVRVIGLNVIGDGRDFLREVGGAGRHLLGESLLIVRQLEPIPNGGEIISIRCGQRAVHFNEKVIDNRQPMVAVVPREDRKFSFAPKQAWGSAWGASSGALSKRIKFVSPIKHNPFLDWE